jgi:predicted NBD/HSP70 family sugar kinase
MPGTSPASIRPRQLKATAPGSIRRGPSSGLVLRTVLHHGPIPRSAIAQVTGLSPAAVSGHSAELTRLGLLREAPNSGGARIIGRPHVPVDIDTETYVVGAVHVAVGHTTAAVLDLRGQVIAQRRIPHTAAQPEEVLAQAAQALNELLAAHVRGRTPLGVGIATGGWVDEQSGTFAEHSMLGWRSVSVREIFGRSTGLRVHVDAHARALLNAERLFGQTREQNSSLSLFVGNMVDAAFGTGDHVHHGPQSQAGAIAHLPVDGSSVECACGRRGCLQATVSDRAIATRAAQCGVIPEVSMTLLIEAARGGNERAVELFIQRAKIVGSAAALLLDVLNPDIMVVTEAGVMNLPVCLETLRDEIRRRSRTRRDPDRTVVATSFPETVLATAGGAVMLDPLYRSPLEMFPEPASRAS